MYFYGCSFITSRKFRHFDERDSPVKQYFQDITIYVNIILFFLQTSIIIETQCVSIISNGSNTGHSSVNRFQRQRSGGCVHINEPGKTFSSLKDGVENKDAFSRRGVCPTPMYRRTDMPSYRNARTVDSGHESYSSVEHVPWKKTLFIRLNIIYVLKLSNHQYIKNHYLQGQLPPPPPLPPRHPPPSVPSAS